MAASLADELELPTLNGRPTLDGLSGRFLGLAIITDDNSESRRPACLACALVTGTGKQAVFLAINCFLHLCCISFTLDLYFCDRSVNSLEVRKRQFNADCADILLKTIQFSCARDRCDPRILCQQPGNGNLRMGRLLGRGNVGNQRHQGLVSVSCFRLEAWKRVTNILGVELRIVGYRAGQKAFAQRTEGHEADTQLL